MNQLTLEQALQQRILVIDGAMGTMIQRHRLTEEDFRAERFANHPVPLKGNNDLLCLTQPQIIADIHRQYLLAGADIIETNTFNSTVISQADYRAEAWVYELNYEAARIARQVADEITTQTPAQTRYVAGAIGPTNQTLSLSPDVNRPGYRAVTFQQIADAYYTQAKGLLEGGVDALLVETVFDTLNCKAALFGIMQLFEDLGRSVPIMISVTITDQSGRTLSGQTVEAFYNSISHVPLLSVGLNCALGASEMRPYLKTLAHLATCYVSVYPNAGLPNAFGGYDETPQRMAAHIADFAKNAWVNIVGGCCGTTPEYIAAMVKAVQRFQPRQLPVAEFATL
ncbi:MAG: homocysteine S-methyltransferase family protein [Chitinophagales bacterium]|nr:homocysteine S-methyltransferase family protein [Chitinophagales bacterium]HNL07922.1 homocysteine S-methyltransferase family protein [Chitinophagales bacterium]